MEPKPITEPGKTLLQAFFHGTFPVSHPEKDRVDRLALSFTEIRAFVLARRAPDSASLLLSQSAFLAKVGRRLSSHSALILQQLPRSHFSVIPIRAYTYKKVIEIPLRGLRCVHYDVVDLEYLLVAYQQTGLWKCPICGKTMELKSVYVDFGVKSAIERLGNTKKDLLLYVKGKGTYIPIDSRNVEADINAHALDLGIDVYSSLFSAAKLSQNDSIVLSLDKTACPGRLEVSLQYLGGAPPDLEKKRIPVIVLGRTATLELAAGLSFCTILAMTNTLPSTSTKAMKTALCKFAEELGDPRLVTVVIADPSGKQEWELGFAGERERYQVLEFPFGEVGAEKTWRERLNKANAKLAAALSSPSSSHKTPSEAFTSAFKAFNPREVVKFEGKFGCLISAQIDSKAAISSGKADTEPGLITLFPLQTHSSAQTYCLLCASKKEALARPCVFVKDEASFTFKDNPKIAKLRIEGNVNVSSLFSTGMMASHFAVAELKEENLPWIAQVISARTFCPCLKSYPLLLFADKEESHILGKLLGKAWKETVILEPKCGAKANLEGNLYFVFTSGDTTRLDNVCEFIIRSLGMGERHWRAGIRKELMERIVGAEVMKVDKGEYVIKM